LRDPLLSQQVLDIDGSEGAGCGHVRFLAAAAFSTYATVDLKCR
jgi:hypothetical protein